MSREGITLRCNECKMENYITKKNKQTQTEKLEVKKFCAKCNGHKMHSEKKKK